MALRRHLLFVYLLALASMGASFPTTNFLVDAPTPQIAQQVGQAAEHYRRQKAIDWLGQEMPPWSERCPVHVHVTLNGPSGATSFAFDRGQVRGQHMHIEGPLDRLLASVLPHEVTHTVFAHYFRCPVPRWADEGGAVLSEDDMEKDRHDKLVRQILNTPGRMIPLRRLFSLREYPGDVMVLYAEGFSVANYLVTLGGRQTFLGFIAHGMSAYGWDSAVRTFYRYNRIEELEEAWLGQLRSTRRPPVILARNGAGNAPAEPTNRVIVRQTVPPMLATAAPIVRGQAPSEQDGDRYHASVQSQGPVRPGYLPDPPAPASKPGRDGWQPAGSLSYQPLPAPPTVQLLAPQPVPGPATEIGRPVPSLASPVGYPR